MNDKDQDGWRNQLPEITLTKRQFNKHVRKIEGATLRHTRRFITKRWRNILEVQREIIIWLLAVGILIAATGSQMLWSQQTYTTKAFAHDGTYVEAVLGPLETLNPLFASSSAEQSSSYLLFSHLVNYDTTGHLKYDLATDIHINDAKTVYTVKMRSDAKWTDGTKLTADDVAYTIGLMKNTSIDSTTTTDWSSVDVKVIDPTTIQFSLQSTYAAFIHALNFAILPQHILSKVTPTSIREDAYSQKPIGSGPFKLKFVQDVNSTSGRKIAYFVRNDSYYGSKARLSSFQLHTFESTDAIVNALAQNEVNAAAGLASSDISSINKHRYTVKVWPVQSGVYALLNTKSSLLQDAKIRQAMQIGTDTAAVRSKLPKGTPDLYLPFTNGQIGNDTPAAPKYDQTAAKKLLDEDGWKLNKDGYREKDGKPLSLSFVIIKNLEFQTVSEVLAGQWRELGIKVETKVVDPSSVEDNVYQSYLQPRNYDVLLYQLSIGADPDVYAYWHSSQTSSSGLNYANYSNPVADAALLSARSRTEADLRDAKYVTFAKQWLADAPAIGLYQSTVQYAVSNSSMTSADSNKLVSEVDRYADIINWAVGETTVFKTP